MSTQQLDPDAENEKLQQFIFEMGDRQEAFLASLDQKGYRLDYSLDSLPELERYIDARKPEMQWRDKSDAAIELRLDCWSYIGEAFRKSFGGGWNVSLEDLDSVLYGQFVIEKFDEIGQEFDPLGTLQSYLLRGMPSIRSMMEAHVDYTPIDLSDLPEED